MSPHRYVVALSPVTGHTFPPLLESFARWAATQEDGALGRFEALVTCPLPATWDPGAAERLPAAGFSFLELGEGSLIALLETGTAGAPAAVVLLDSEGEARTLATSLEAFLIAWSRGETGVHDLDAGEDDEAAARPALKSWLKTHKIKAPKAAAFDFQAWLDGDADAKPASPAITAPEAPLPEVFATLPPKFRQLAELLGRRVDDPEVVAFAKELGAALPSGTTDTGTAKELKVAEQGFSAWFFHDILNEAYPLIPKTKSSYLPYFKEVSFTDKWAEPLPFGLAFGQSEAEIAAKLGPATRTPVLRSEPDGAQLIMWHVPLLPGRTELRVQLAKKGLKLTLWMVQATALTSRHGVPPREIVGLFVAWAALRGLLDQDAFSAHRDLLKAVAERRTQGSALVAAALPRGLWRTHLVEDRRFFNRAYDLFFGINDLSLDQELIAIFGERPGRINPYGREPVLDEDTWDNVDKATPMFDRHLLKEA